MPVCYFRPIDETLTLLEPMFEIDYLLPRTFLTAVRLKELNSVIKTEKIPVEICLANLIYNIKITRPGLYRDFYTGNFYFQNITSDERVSVVIYTHNLLLFIVFYKVL